MNVCNGLMCLFNSSLPFPNTRRLDQQLFEWAVDEFGSYVNLLSHTNTLFATPLSHGCFHWHICRRHFPNDGTLYMSYAAFFKHHIISSLLVLLAIVAFFGLIFYSLGRLCCCVVRHVVPGSLRAKCSGSSNGDVEHQYATLPVTEDATHS